VPYRSSAVPDQATVAAGIHPAILPVQEISQMTAIDIRTHGAQGQGADDTAAIQAAIEDAHAAGGGLVQLPPGEWFSGTVFLKSHVTIEVCAGATWRGVTELDAYPMIEPHLHSRMDITPWRAFIYAAGQEDIGLCGNGHIRPGGENAVWADYPGNSPERPYGIHFIGCCDVVVRDVHLSNSAFWMQRYLACDGLRLDGVRVWNHCHKNNDGVDIDSCRNVVVSDCQVDSSDDGICLKSEGADPCENVVISNCVVASEASAIKFGTGSIGGFKKVCVSNCVVRPSASPVVTHALKAEAGLVGIDIGIVDGGALQDVLISNIVIEGVETPIFVKLGDRQSRLDGGAQRWFERQGRQQPDAEVLWPGAPAVRPGSIVGLRIDNIIARNVGPIACALVGYPGNPLHNLRLDRIEIHCSKGVDEQPSYEVDTQAKLYPMNRIFNSPLPAYGLYLRDVDGLELGDVRLFAADGDPRPGVVVEDSRDVVLRDIRCTGAGASDPVLRGCEGIGQG